MVVIATSETNQLLSQILKGDFIKYADCFSLKVYGTYHPLTEKVPFTIASIKIFVIEWMMYINVLVIYILLRFFNLKATGIESFL